MIEMKITSGSEWVPLVGVSKILLKLRSIIFIKFQAQNLHYFKVCCLLGRDRRAHRTPHKFLQKLRVLQARAARGLPHETAAYVAECCVDT